MLQNLGVSTSVKEVSCTALCPSGKYPEWFLGRGEGIQRPSPPSAPPHPLVTTVVIYYHPLQADKLLVGFVVNPSSHSQFYIKTFNSPSVLPLFTFFLNCQML